ncbi:hypothetical protein ACNKHX_20485 [Shigella flexneri]
MSGFEDRSATPASAGAHQRSSDGLSSAFNGRLYQLHHTAVFPHPSNFQRVPTVDTSNPFAAKGIPSLDESFVVIHFRNLEGIDFPWLLAMLQGSFISRRIK